MTPWLWSLLGGCLVDWDIYYKRLAELTDDDGDGVHEVDGDCDDADRTVYPGADEHCDDRDEDCDSEVDEGAVDAGTWFTDSDGDGYGDASQQNTACEVPAGWVQRAGDCDDSAVKVSPTGTEVCNDTDDDCDGQTDEEAIDAPLWYQDEDSDGYGVAGTSVRACAQPDRTASVSGDCDDASAAVSPDEIEVCGDGLDNDCDGSVGSCGWNSTIELTEQMSIFGNTVEDYLGEAGVIADLNGDGTAELVVGAPLAYQASTGKQPGAIFAFDVPITLTSQSMTTADRHWWGTYARGGLAFGLQAADINGDLYEDMITGALGGSTNHTYAGQGYIIYGPIVSGFTIEKETPDWVLDGTNEYQMLSERVYVLGDIDGDGTEDFAIGNALSDYGSISQAGFIYIYTSAGSGQENADRAAYAEIHGYDPSDFLSWSMVGADVDADGNNEVIIGAWGAYVGDGEVYLFEYDTLATAETGLDADDMWRGENPGNAGTALDAGDMNGDGATDLIIGGRSAQNGSAYIVWGGADVAGGYLGDAPVTIRGGTTTNFATELRVGDLNGDNADDLVIAEGLNVPDNVYVFYGPFPESATLYSTDADVKLLGDGEWDQEYETLLIGELTGDDINDLVVGTPFGHEEKGIVYIIPGAGL